MNDKARRAQRLRQLKQAGWAWCILVGIAGSIGGVLALIERESDDA